jgi:hypothetical protein
MVIKNKKGFMKSIEILLTVVFTVLFLLVIIPSQESLKVQENPYYLINIENDIDFRNFIANNNDECYNKSQVNTATQKISKYLPDYYNFNLCIDIIPNNLPPVKVDIDSIVIVGNYTNPNFKIVKLFYWQSS